LPIVFAAARRGHVVVKIACLAQLVNVIPPIRTQDGGRAWRQTTYFPFMHVARFGRGTVLRLEPHGPGYEGRGRDAGRRNAAGRAVPALVERRALGYVA
jgi:alpha-L-arabinofuranosidase